MCHRYVSTCSQYQQGVTTCQTLGEKMVAPANAAHNVFVSYLAAQRQIYVAKSDRAIEGTWKREGKKLLCVSKQLLSAY